MHTHMHNTVYENSTVYSYMYRSIVHVNMRHIRALSDVACISTVDCMLDRICILVLYYSVSLH